MKKLVFLAICAMAVMISCKQKGQTAPADNKDSVTTAVIDSIIEENDTTPLPMFLIGTDGKYRQMLYWASLEEPQRSEGDEDFFDIWHKRWELQEMFRRNAAQYTNLLNGDKIVKVKFIDEVLKDPDGNTPSIGEIHGREEIPARCIFSIGGDYTFGPVTVALNVHNLLGTRYHRSGMNTNVIPQQGRWFMGSITARF